MTLRRAPMPLAIAADDPLAPPSSVAEQPPRSFVAASVSQAWFQQLEKLMAWRERGLLTDAEFRAAKAKLGL